METSLSYPIGKFEGKPNYSPEELKSFVESIRQLPYQIETATLGLTEKQLDTPYRESGWTVRQVVHHLADSHMNAYIRVKWALTESNPVIKAYNEKEWAVTNDSLFPIAVSLELLRALHVKWSKLLETLSSEDHIKSFVHPQSGKTFTLATLMAMYAWHGQHHLAHITNLKARNGW